MTLNADRNISVIDDGIWPGYGEISFESDHMDERFATPSFWNFFSQSIRFMIQHILPIAPELSYGLRYLLYCLLFCKDEGFQIVIQGIALISTSREFDDGKPIADCPRGPAVAVEIFTRWCPLGYRLTFPRISSTPRTSLGT